jgi:hypothetical protein
MRAFVVSGIQKSNCYSPLQESCRQAAIRPERPSKLQSLSTPWLAFLTLQQNLPAQLPVTISLQHDVDNRLQRPKMHPNTPAKPRLTESASSNRAVFFAWRKLHPSPFPHMGDWRDPVVASNEETGSTGSTDQVNEGNTLPLTSRAGRLWIPRAVIGDALSYHATHYGLRSTAAR